MFIMFSSVSMSLCLYVSLSLFISVSPLYLSQTYPYLKYVCLLTCLPARLSLSLSLSPPPSLFPDKKFPVEAHFWLDKLFYYIEDVHLLSRNSKPYIGMMSERFSSSCNDFATPSLTTRIRFEMQREKTLLLWIPSMWLPKKTRADISKPCSKRSL